MGSEGSIAFEREKHIKYIQELDTKREDIEYWYTSHLRISMSVFFY